MGRMIYYGFVNFGNKPVWDKNGGTQNQYMKVNKDSVKRRNMVSVVMNYVTLGGS